jgi:putative aldouronate transport system substrate-binding protein
MKRKGKLISITVVIAMMLAMLAGCGQATPLASASVAPVATTAPAASVAAEATTAAPAVPSWLVDTTPRTVEWYVASSDYNSSWDPNVAYAAKVLRDKTGITINFSFPVGGDQDEKLNTMIASDSLTDIIAVGESSQQFPMLEQGQKLQPLNKMMDQFAPAFKALLPQSMVGWCTFSDGNLYGIPSHFFATEKLDSSVKLTTNTGMMARKEIMDKLGITADDFMTQDGAVKALEKVRDGNITYNGKKVIPFYVGYDVVDDTDWFLREMFAVPYENPDGTLANKFHSPQYLEMLQFLSRCYNDGLMSQENFTGTYDTQAEKLTSGQIFSIAGCRGDWYAGMDLYRNDKTVNWIGVGPIHPLDGSPVYVKSSSMTGWLMTCIPNTTKNPERMLALMNFLYSDEGHFLTTVGVEGQTFTIQNGKAILNPDIQAEFTADHAKAFAKWGFSGATSNEGVMWMMYDPIWGKKYAPAPADPADVMYNNIRMYCSQNVVPAAAFEACDPDPGTPEADIKAQVDNIRNEELAKIILSKTPAEVEANWNAYVEKVDALGYDKVVAAMNLKFQAHKKALGLQFAWPTNK